MLAAGLAAFLVDEPDAATSALKSGRAVALMLAVGAGWVAARIVLGGLAPWPLVRLLAFAAAALAVLAVVVVPAYDDDTIVETLPPTVVPAPSTAVTEGGRPGAKATPEPAPGGGAGGVQPAGPAAGSPAAPLAAAPGPPATPAPQRVGRFRGVDHRASGTVAFYHQPDGRYVVGLERIDIQPGPDYDVYLVPGSGRTDRRGGVRLDDLRANPGTHYYEVPPAVNPFEGPWTVLVWCQRFDVPVATATPG